jgi:hypothetical protein
MQAQVYDGYFDNGMFYTKERQVIKMPERCRVTITLFDEKIEQKEEKASRRSAFGCLKGKISVPDNFNEPLEDFAEYM